MVVKNLTKEEKQAKYDAWEQNRRGLNTRKKVKGG